MYNVVEKTFVGYGIVIVAGALGFIVARNKVYSSRGDVLAAKERITRQLESNREYEQAYPYYTEEARKAFEKELAEKKNTSKSQ